MENRQWKETYLGWEEAGSSEEWLSFFEETLDEYKAQLVSGTKESFLSFLKEMDSSYKQESESWLDHLLSLAAHSQEIRQQKQREKLDISVLEREIPLFEEMLSAMTFLESPPPGLEPGMSYEIKKSFLLKSFRGSRRIVSLAVPDYGEDPQASMAVLNMIPPSRACQLYVELAKTARKEGLLALEDYLPELPAVIGEYMTLVVDGNDPLFIEKTIDSHFYGWQLAQQSLKKVFTLGIKGLFDGENPRVLETLLTVPFSSFPPEVGQDKFQNNNELCVEILVEMAEEARKNGLLSLQDFELEEPTFPARMLKEIVLAVLDLGDSGPAIEELTTLLFERLEAELRLAQGIITKGTLMVQGGDNPEVIKGELESLLPKYRPLPSELSEYGEALSSHEMRLGLIPLAELYDQYARLLRGKPSLSCIHSETLQKLKSRYEASLQGMKDFQEQETRAYRLLEEIINQRRNELHNLYCRRFPDLGGIKAAVPRASRESLAEKLAMLQRDIREEQREALSRIARERRDRLSRLFAELDWPDERVAWSDVEEEKQELLEKPILDHVLSLYRPAFHEIQGVVEKLEDADPEFAEELKRNIFVFEDILLLDDRGIQKILRETDQSLLAQGLKGCDQDVIEKILRNMSRRAGELLKEDMEYMGPVKRTDRDKAQTRILSIILKLIENGEIVMPASRDDESWLE